MRKSVPGYIGITVLLVLMLSGCGKASTLYFDAGMAYLENGQYAEAEENFTTSLSTEAETKECYRGLGIALMGEERYSEAEEAFLKALSASKGSISEIDYDINYYLGYAYRMNGEYENAVDTFSAIIALKPKDMDAYYQRALCYLELGMDSEADGDIVKVTAANPSDYGLCLDIYFAMKDVGADVQADSFLRATLENGDKKMTDYDKGKMLFYLEDYSEARVYLEKSKDYSDPNTYLMLGKTYEATGDYSYAATLYNAYLSEKGNNAEVYNQLGISRCKAGDYEGAVTAFSFGLKLDDPNWNRTLLYNEAVAYEYMLDFDGALEMFTEYCEKYPRDTAAQRELVFLETR